MKTVRPGFLVFLAIWAYGGLTTAAPSGYYIRFIEAEDFVLAPGGFQHGVNRSAGYRGERYVFRILKETPKQPLRMTKVLERDLPPGDYGVFVRVHSEGTPRSRVFHIKLNDGEAEVPFPLEKAARHRNWIGADIHTERPGRDLEIAVTMKEPGRIIVDSVLVTSDPSVVVAKGTKITRKAPARAGQLPAAGRNLLANGGFEIGSTGWRTGYQCGYVIEASDIVGRLPARGDRCLKVRLRREIRRKDVYRTYGGIMALPCDVSPGEKYSLSAYVRASAPVKAALLAVLASPDGTHKYKQVAARTLEAGAEWVRLAGSFGRCGLHLRQARGGVRGRGSVRARRRDGLQTCASRRGGAGL